MRNKKFWIFFNAMLGGADLAVSLLSFLEGSLFYGVLLGALGIGIGYFAWSDLHE